MAKFPHAYQVRASADAGQAVVTEAEGKAQLSIAAPVAFGGPGSLWSPEELLLASLADCFILTFKALAKISDLSWRAIDCRASGTLDRENGQIFFSAFHLECTLEVDGDEARARDVLLKAKASCFVSNALKVTPTLESKVSLV